MCQSLLRHTETAARQYLKSQINFLKSLNILLFQVILLGLVEFVQLLGKRAHEFSPNPLDFTLNVQYYYFHEVGHKVNHTFRLQIIARHFFFT